MSSGRGRPRLIPYSGVALMLKAAHLGLATSSGSESVRTTCEDVAIDPGKPGIVVAGFQAAQQGSIPPVFQVALATRNMGRSWTFVPPPSGFSLVDFSGFVEELHTIAMVYSRNYFFPMKPGQSATLVAVEPNSARYPWNDVYIGCPANRPCVIFGPQSPQGACGMSEWEQSVLEGSQGINGLPPRWHPAGNLSQVGQCGSQQLVTSIAGVEYLLDRSRPTALNLTRDGASWTPVALPKIGRATVGSTPLSSNQVLTLAADGTLVAIVGTPFRTVDRIEILNPESSKWCAAATELPSKTKQDPVVAAQSSQSTLVISYATPLSTSHLTPTAAQTIPLSELNCRR